MPVIGDMLSVMGKTLFPHNVRYSDIVKGVPVKDGSASGVHCSHVLEHVDRENVTRALANTFQLFEPGGIFRLVIGKLQTHLSSVAILVVLNTSKAFKTD